eukprot:1180533-Prorocentrum_minimum.AAC.2
MEEQRCEADVASCQSVAQNPKPCAADCRIESWEKSGWCARVCLMLMMEMALGDQSVFQAYLQSIPRAVPVPLLWSEEERRALEGTEVYQVRPCHFKAPFIHQAAPVAELTC